MKIKAVIVDRDRLIDSSYSVGTHGVKSITEEFRAVSWVDGYSHKKILIYNVVFDNGFLREISHNENLQIVREPKE